MKKKLQLNIYKFSGKLGDQFSLQWMHTHKCLKDSWKSHCCAQNYANSAASFVGLAPLSLSFAAKHPALAGECWQPFQCTPHQQAPKLY